MKPITYDFSPEIRTFLQEKKYLQNVSPQTIVLYETSFKAFYGCANLEDIKQRVVVLRERGIKPVSVNTYLRHMKTFFLWKGLEWKCPWLQEEQKLIETLPVDAMSRLIAYKPQGKNLVRAHILALTILDTGLRASEALGLTVEDVDLENLVFKVRGKGGKHRLVPFSTELRKSTFRLVMNPGNCGRGSLSHYVFGTKNQTKVSIRNFERDLDILGKQIGLILRPHNLRHCFAVNYLKRGGNLEFLRRILGHTQLTTTQKYLRALGIADLQAVHSQFSVLSGR